MGNRFRRSILSGRSICEPVGSELPAAFKEKNMKRTIALCLGVLGLALLPALAQTPAPATKTGKVHGHVTNPAGAAQVGGSVTFTGGSLSGAAAKFPVDDNGDFSAEVPPGTYKLVYRAVGLGDDKETDHIENVKVTIGADIVQNIDMTRKEYLDTLSPEARKQAEEFRKKNAEALQANVIIKNINADMVKVLQDFKDTDGARAAAKETLGAAATKAEIDAKEAELKAAKYTEVEGMMLKDTGAKADASILWGYLGQAEAGLKKYDLAETAFKKALDVDTTSKKPSLAIQGMAQAGLGEVYARTGKVADANAAFDAASKLDPTRAGVYYKNEAVFFDQSDNAEAEVGAAEKAIQADPTQALPYYLKGKGLIVKATVDASGKYVLPPGCAEAYQKYLDLAPKGPYAADVAAILAQSTQTVSNNYKADKKKK
jgi:tetratricopeptide (TPR) repeat protein